MENIVKWIQISDIHYQLKTQNFNTKQLREKLVGYLKGLKESVDVLILTGDYRYAPEGEENPTGVVEYIRDVAGAIHAEKIVTMPGNHDLTRGAVRDAVILQVRNNYNPEEGTFDPEILQQFLNGFVFYDSMHEILADSSEFEKNNPHTIAEMEKCNLLILNTALTAGEKDDEGNLIIGSSYLASAISKIKNDKPIIAVGHHGFEYLQNDEQRKCEKYLDNHNVRLYLCGHAHNAWFSSFGEKGKQITSGCLKQEDNSVYAGFSIGTLYENGTVKINSHKWDISEQDWFPDPSHNKEYSNLYDSTNIVTEEGEDEKEKPEKIENDLSICGYKLLGGLGVDGIKYIWKKKEEYIESLAFNRRLKRERNPSDSTTSAYTISTSIGCVLSNRKQQCQFCETGTRKFEGNLSAENIALQCIFMAQYDSNCPSYPEVRNNKREFAFMGQGEPGYNYLAIRQAIKLTDYAMERIGQEVSRYIISSCGISSFMPHLIEDIKHNVFKNKVTLHFSLHAINEERDRLMPINKEQNYQEFIKYCKMLNQVTGDKIGVGILMFNNYRITDGKKYSLTKKKLEEILNELDKDVFRIDLCTVNKNTVGNQHQLSNEKANELLKIVWEKGYEGKLFTSFGDSDQSGCGMLFSSIEDMEEAGATTIKQFNQSVELLNDAKSYMDQMLTKRD